mmetsp:Transcript_15358/g.25634  ORF Transcript_15358/g.25634 Transcript_15358/m.25634 type:complete len:257 (-) Transcript_15358:802-1572(-)
MRIIPRLKRAARLDVLISRVHVVAVPAENADIVIRHLCPAHRLYLDRLSYSIKASTVGSLVVARQGFARSVAHLVQHAVTVLVTSSSILKNATAYLTRTVGFIRVFTYPPHYQPIFGTLRQTQRITSQFLDQLHLHQYFHRHPQNHRLPHQCPLRPHHCCRPRPHQHQVCLLLHCLPLLCRSHHLLPYLFSRHHLVLHHHHLFHRYHLLVHRRHLYCHHLRRRKFHHRLYRHHQHHRHLCHLLRHRHHIRAPPLLQ